MSEQRTIDWYRDRLGFITGSQVGLLCARLRNGELSKTAQTYLYSVASERLLDASLVMDDDMFETYIDLNNSSSKAMSYGAQKEALARETYKNKTNTEVESCGSLKHESLEFRSSPDGIIRDLEGNIGALEIKCPLAKNFAYYSSSIHDALSLKQVNSDYYWQCYAHMLVLNAQFCDFVIFSEFHTPCIKVVRIHRDESEMLTLISAINEGNSFINNVIEHINGIQ